MVIYVYIPQEVWTDTWGDIWYWKRFFPIPVPPRPASTSTWTKVMIASWAGIVRREKEKNGKMWIKSSRYPSMTSWVYPMRKSANKDRREQYKESCLSVPCRLCPVYTVCLQVHGIWKVCLVKLFACGWALLCAIVPLASLRWPGLFRVLNQTWGLCISVPRMPHTGAFSSPFVGASFCYGGPKPLAPCSDAPYQHIPTHWLPHICSPFIRTSVGIISIKRGQRRKSRWNSTPKLSIRINSDTMQCNCVWHCPALILHMTNWKALKI